MMDDIRERIKLMGSFGKQFLVMLAFMGAFLFFFQIRETMRTVENQEELMISEMQNKLQLANLYTDYYVDNIQSSLISITSRDDLYLDRDREHYFALSDIKKKNGFISTLFVAGEDGRLKASSQALYEAKKPDIVGEMVERAQSGPDMVQFSSPFYSTMSAGYSIYASYKDGANIAVIEAGCNYLKSIFQSVMEGKNSAFIIMDREGKVFLFSGEEHGIRLKKGVYPLEVDDGYSCLPFETLQEMELCVSDKVPEHYFMYSDSNRMGWRICSFFSREVLESYKSNLYFNTALRLAVWFLGVVVAVFWFTAFCARPVRRLAKDMDEVNDLEHLVEVDYRREDELIGRISLHYNRLVRRIRSLVEEVREAERKKMEYEFLMLQNQIGPHFLHNTLACIASLIRQGKSDVAQDALKALIKLLSYTFEQNEKTVTIKEETDEIANYIKIQQMRYGSRIQFVQETDGEALQCRILKLLLQPLVENAIFHGIVPKGEGIIRITVRQRGDVLNIFICDDGVGMTREMCRKVLCGETIYKRTDRFSGVGIINVNERLKMKYGERFGIQIKSEIGFGTIICLRIPQDKV